MLALIVLQQNGIAQHTAGRWSASLRTGINSFITDFNESKIGFGLEARGMFGLSGNVSVGALVGYEELKTHLIPNTLGLPYDYVKLHAFPFAALGTYHALPGNKIAPYFYGGLGLLLYQRLDWQQNGLPDDQLNTSILIPLGVGIEMFLHRNLSLSAEIGYRILDDKTETVEDGGFDSYASAKVGAELYFGRGDDDDDDLDGLSNGEEQKEGTDPDQVDSDGDGLKDGDEVRLYRSDPLLVDTDNDGLSDIEEIYQWKSDPTSLDTDNDGLNDLEEKDLGTNPINADTDGDVLTDGEEKTAGSNPLSVDTDEDGVSDYLELKTYMTTATESDTDQDSLSDGAEITIAQTDPLMADTDGGGTMDGIEVARRTNPLDPADDVITQPALPGMTQPMLVYGVSFVSDKAVIRKGSETELENAFVSLVLLGVEKVDIVYHTDNVGNAAANDRLSQARAEALVKWFVEKGIDETRLRAIGKGGTEPIAPNDTEEGRAQNRRIELRVRE